jgi:hypothetical protein
MNKYFFLQPRRSGKTTMALYEFSKDPENTIFVSPNTASVEYLKCKVNKEYVSNFISSSRFIDFIKGRSVKNLILDEYLFFKNNKEIYKNITLIQPENIYIFSTPYRIYDKEIFELVKNHKKNYSVQELSKFLSHPSSEKIDELDELYYNFISDEDTKLIRSFVSMMDPKSFHYLNHTTFITEILGKFLKTETYE